MKLVLLLMAALGAAAQTPLTDRERMLLDRIEKLEKRIEALEGRSGGAQTAVAANSPATPPASASNQPPLAKIAIPAPSTPPSTDPPALPLGTSLRLELDGYYAYNFNNPFNAANQLRAYDGSHNSFSLNQAALIIERAPNVEKGRRIGGRLDLMFGQATETLQGSAANERRPEVFRHVFQAYGTYVAPVGKGLTVDFGKFASSFGIEGNYTKDQLNYSRSFAFNFLPFYHMGFRATYPVTGKFSASYWAVNGLNQTEDFNGFKSQAVVLTFNPTSKITANVNYYNGQEQRAVNGVAPRGRTHIVDSYITWTPSDRWTFAAEGDYVVSRVNTKSGPELATGASGYAQYRFHPRFRFASRFEYLNDTGRLFSGTSQALKAATATATFDVTSGFQMRWEFRRDWSNAAYFASQTPGRLRREQTTALLGLVWWFGGKQGLW